MKLKSLDISGFKSFADKTSVQFPHGISAVVGPNGCGKSNIVDALRWVMGEQSVKQLRGKSMEDIIFSGTERKGPQNMAEVILTLINDNGSTPEEYRDFSEIMVSRRLYRSGESHYFINKQPCRLKDVHNLLLGTGLGSKAYAIIEQGKISALIDAGPDERRYYIEDAAGVTRYKSRKHEAQLKIKRTERNLLRIQDVVSEIKRQMNSLKRQVRKAERFKEYQGKLHDMEILLAAQQYEGLSERLTETDTLMQSLRDTDFQHTSELAKLDAAIEQIKEERAAKYRNISEQRAQRQDLQRTLDRLEGDIGYRSRDLERLDTEISELKTELSSIEEKTGEITRECEELERRKSALQEKTAHAKEAVSQQAEVESSIRTEVATLNASVETQKARLIDLAGKKATYENTLENATRNRSNLSKRLDQLVHEKEDATRQLGELDKQYRSKEKEQRTLKETIDQAEAVLDNLGTRLQENREALSRQVRKVQEIELERQKARSQYNALKKMDDNYEWFKQGVRSVMQEWKSGRLEKAGIRGLVADVLHPESSYEKAVEAALGDKLQYVIVEDQAGGRVAIDTLHARSSGRGSFVPLSEIRTLGDGEPETLPESTDLLLHHVKVQEGYEDLMQRLLSHVAVTDTLETALTCWKERKAPWAVVTKDGNRISPQGILTGGSSVDSGTGILTKKRELNDLSESVSELTTILKEAKASQENLEMEVISLETNVQQTRQEQHRRNQELVEKEKELYRLGEEKRHTQRHLEVLHLEEQQIEGEWTDVEQELAHHQDVLRGLGEELTTLDDAIKKMVSERESATERLDAAKATVVELRLQLTTLSAEYDSAENTLRRLKDFQRDRDEKRVQLEQGIVQAEQSKSDTALRMESDRERLSELYARLTSVDEVLGESEEAYKAIEGALQQNDQTVSEVRSRQQETNRKIQELELQQSERKIKRDHIVGRIMEKYQQQLEFLLEDVDTKRMSEEETQRELENLKNKIARIGDVNLTAIDEYEELSERYNLLTGQRDDLIEAIEALRRVIRKINRVSLKRFMKTFKAVNQKVQEVFPKLFEGGSAKLELTDPRKPLESGVSYLVRPPGKKLSRMSLLSGGEKALSAITLVFSLFLIKPAAFCVLDEIDAPLDDVNVFRFNQLLREIGRQSQVLMITHDRQTMEVANALFGVTMEQKGISKLISLDISQN